jgi:iron-sulfur cluster assembly protein
MSISLTTSAADRVRSHLARRGHGLGLRLSIKSTGCSGYSYVVDYADTARPDDLVFEDQGIRLYVDPESFPVLDGTRVDFVREGLNESFQFQNPNVKAECGCGESFTV